MKIITLLTLISFCLCVFSLPPHSHAQSDYSGQDGDVRYQVELVTAANYPIALAFAPDGRLFYTEKTTGQVRVISATGQLQREAVIRFTVDATRERGLLGIALDPSYASNGHIWVYYTAAGTARDWPENRVVRFSESDGIGRDPQTMLAVPITNGETEHNGGNLYFDAAGLLYVSIGDYREPSNSQSLATLPGKLHRFAVTEAGLAVPEDNPYADNSLYALGLRNSWDFTFDPFSGGILATENGQFCDDEINLLLGGFNYGAGAYSDQDCMGTDGMVDVALYMPPLLAYNPTVAPTGIMVYDHDAVTAWQGEVFFCAWNSGQLTRLTLNAARDAVVSTQALDLGEASCRIDIAQGPDGALYFSTVEEGSGAIYRLMPFANEG
jgi:aldose sugar dehydrogenase